MNRFKNILAVYNDAVGDDGALAQATAMAKRNDARLTVIEVDKDADALPTSACDPKRTSVVRRFLFFAR